jgi:hypothetical protein
MDRELSLFVFGSALEDTIFLLERTGLSCTDNERVDGALCHQRHILLRDYLLSCQVSFCVEEWIDWVHPHVQSL